MGVGAGRARLPKDQAWYQRSEMVNYHRLYWAEKCAEPILARHSPTARPVIGVITRWMIGHL
jgi:hypothetical protein